MDDKHIAKSKAKLKKMKDLLEKYKKAFSEDGLIDTDEQRQIDELSEVIQRLEEKIENPDSTTEEQTTEQGGNSTLSALLDEINDFLGKLDEKFGQQKN